jgi:hypothetical protein
LEHVAAVRYLVPLREGGSLPAIVDTEPPGQYVVKFRGAGQGPKALAAEVLAASLAETLGLPVPTPVLVELDEGFGRGEPDPEIQDLLRGSVGTNFGLGYLAGAVGYDAAVDAQRVEPELAAGIVWFDALIVNVDRTPRNPNLLLWQDRLWLIDHGAALYFHHAGAGWEARAQAAFPQIKDHILLARAESLTTADARLRPLLTDAAIVSSVANLPESWLGSEPDAARQAYVTFVVDRLNGPRAWLEEAERARRG